ncbi:hypothetical protein R3I94_006995 [Phoxinus phoxinus]
MITLTLTPVSSLEASSSTQVTLPPQHSTPVQHSTWPSTFQVPWDKTRPSLRTCLELRKRPEETDRRHMVRVTVDAMREICLNPTLSQCAVVAMSIIEQYPDCFEDRTDEGDRMGSGHFTLCSQFKTRLDNLNRNNTLARLRKPKRPAVTVENSLPVPSRKCAKTDSYGCINWQPSELPEGETRHSLSDKKKELKSTFTQEGQNGADKARVNELMMITYEAQRRAINTSPAPSIDQLKTDWPFLFMKRFLIQHFSTLTGIELESRLRESISGKETSVLHFFKSQLMRWRKEVRTVLADTERASEDVDPGLAAILVMMAFFKEKEDSLFLLADDPVVRQLIKDLKWKVSMEVLARLRATNPETPMASIFYVVSSLNPAHQSEDSFFESLAQIIHLPDNEGDHRADDSQAESLRMQETYPEFSTLNMEDLLDLD